MSKGWGITAMEKQAENCFDAIVSLYLHPTPHITPPTPTFIGQKKLSFPTHLLCAGYLL